MTIARFFAELVAYATLVAGLLAACILIGY
jgi:hypothetical protein